jgi:hypothetical protein
MCSCFSIFSTILLFFLPCYPPASGDRYTLLVLFVYLISGLGVVVGGICHLFKSPFGVAGRKKEFVCFDVLMEWIGLGWIERIPRVTTPTSSGLGWAGRCVD